MKAHFKEVLIIFIAVLAAAYIGHRLWGEQ
jgi:hypothetical protein